MSVFPVDQKRKSDPHSKEHSFTYSITCYYNVDVELVHVDPNDKNAINLLRGITGLSATDLLRHINSRPFLLAEEISTEDAQKLIDMLQKSGIQARIL